MGHGMRWEGFEVGLSGLGSDRDNRLPNIMFLLFNVLKSIFAVAKVYANQFP